MPVSVVFQDLSARVPGSQNDDKSGTLAEVVARVMDFLGSDSLNMWDGGWLGRGTLGCTPAGLHSSSGCLQDTRSAKEILSTTITELPQTCFVSQGLLFQFSMLFLEMSATSGVIPPKL